MRDVVVALDLETTGLDPATDHIIEVGAIKFQGERVLDELQILVNPGYPLPHYVTQLTGLSDHDLVGAPPLSESLPHIKRFIGQAPVLGHNVRFDAAFLQTHGLLHSNPLIDTYAIASALFPTLTRYNLSALAALFGLPSEGAHRALTDAYMALGIYRELWKRAFDLPLYTLTEIVRAGQHMTWDGHLFFAAALQERLQEQGTSQEHNSNTRSLLDLEDLFPQIEPDIDNEVENSIAALAKESLKPLDIKELAALIEPGGTFEAAFPLYEHRPQQTAMLQTVAKAFNEGQHIFIEAPTGVGKSIAYLIPAIYFARQNRVRVVISTHTLSLQDQLINKDIPLLEQTLGITARATVLKGRNHYLCPRRLSTLRHRGPTSPDEMLMLARLLVWLTLQEPGEISLRGPAESEIWYRLSAEGEGCTLNRCLTQTDGRCPFYQARRAAEKAQLLIVNHSLLLADVATENRVLPDYRYLIVDEAHHLEGAITASLSFRADLHSIRRQLMDLGTNHTGLLGDLLRQCRSAIPPRYFKTLEEYVGIVTHVAKLMAQHAEWFFQALQRFIDEHTPAARDDYVQRIRILDNLRQQPDWGNVKTSWDRLSQFSSGIVGAMQELQNGLQSLADYDIEEYDDLLVAVRAAARHLTDLHQHMDQFVNRPDLNRVYWVELSPGNEGLSLHAAPLQVGSLVREHLWNKKETIILTSATLQTNDSFAYIRDRLDADHLDEVIIDTSFDYKASTLLYLVDDIPEPTEQAAYQLAVEQGILALCRATQGRALILFTSHTQLRQTANAISDSLAQDGIILYDQSGGGSQAQLLDGFIRSERAVLMGTRAFWEGVDIPGADLSVLVIVRLPFSVPTDPLFAARSEMFARPFVEYALPETILRFRQGFGRLIRRKDDRGIVAIFDRRIISKSYGRLFLEALPPCTIQRGRLADLPVAAVQWLAAS